MFQHQQLVHVSSSITLVVVVIIVPNKAKARCAVERAAVVLGAAAAVRSKQLAAVPPGRPRDFYSHPPNKERAAKIPNSTGTMGSIQSKDWIGWACGHAPSVTRTTAEANGRRLVGLYSPPYWPWEAWILPRDKCVSSPCGRVWTRLTK